MVRTVTNPGPEIIVQFKISRNQLDAKTHQVEKLEGLTSKPVPQPRKDMYVPPLLNWRSLKLKLTGSGNHTADLARYVYTLLELSSCRKAATHWVSQKLLKVKEGG